MPCPQFAGAHTPRRDDRPQYQHAASDVELKCLKDADGLDRVRINDLEPDLLRTEAARLLVDQAWDLYRLTRSAKDPWAAVRQAAENRGW